MLVALPGSAHAGKTKLSSETVLGVPCSDIFKLGIDKQENLRASMIRVGCGLEAAGAPGEEADGSDAVNDLINVNTITGPEPFPHVTQSESMVWSTPDGVTVVVNYNDSNTAPSNYSGVSVSVDSGQSFQRILPAPFATGHGTNFGDPIVVYNNALGKWFAGDIATACGGAGIGLWTSDNGMTWTTGACAHTGGNDDRESMWVDNNAASPFYGRMYVSLNDFAQGQSIFVTHSDNGTTWSAPVRVQSGTFIRNIQLTGSPGDDGTVFIAGMNEGGGGTNNRINWIYRSLDGGANWTAIQQGPPFAPPGLALCGYFAAIPPIWRHMGWGQPGVGPNGVVHYAYAGRGANSGDLGDIFYIRSEDNGTTWSTPIVLNSDAAKGGNKAQWMPSLSVTPEGNVVISWYDRRNTTDGTNYEWWGIQSPDNGLSFGQDERYSDTLIQQPEQPDTALVACYAGDYNYHSAVSSNSWLTWTDGRNPISGHYQQDVYFASIEQVVTGGTLEGTVMDSTGALVVGARVRAVGPVDRTASTNRDGFYRLRLPGGTYDMTVTATDYNPASAQGVVVVDGATTTQNFTLTGQGILEGTVMASANAPLAGARVEVVGPVTRSTTTDPNGFYRFRLPVGTYDMTVTIFAYDPGSATVGVVDGMTTTQDFTLALSPAHSVSGTIVSNVTGLPVPDATVRVLGTPIPPATSDKNGMYRLPSVPDGSYDLRASPPPSSGLIPRTVPIVVDMDITQDFALDAAQAHIGFEPPDYQGSAQGVMVTGQQGWYLPNVAGSTHQFVYTYAGNALGLPANALGEEQFLGARVSGSNLNRAQLDFDWTASTVWTASYDFAARFNGTLPAVDNLGSFSLQDSVVARYFIALDTWVNPAVATLWNANYNVFNAAGIGMDLQSPGPEWRNLAVNHWYRQSTSFDFASNRVLSVSITDLDTGVTATFAPTNWYMAGGAGGSLPLPTALRFFIGGDTVVAGNTMGWDNLVIVSGGPAPGPSRNDSRLPETVMPSAPGLATD